MANRRYTRCDREADYVLVGKRQMAARCLEHARAARLLGHNLRTVMPEERRSGVLDLAEFAR